MRVDFDVPSHIQNYDRDFALFAAAISLVAAIVVGTGFYFFDSGDAAVTFGSIITFLVLQPVLQAIFLQFGPMKSDMWRIGEWIRIYGPDLHERILSDLRSTGDAIWSSHPVTFDQKVYSTDLTESQLTWAINSELYSLREIAVLRLMRKYMPLYGHLVGFQEVVHGFYAGTLPFYVVSTADIAACSL